ncbi:MAG: winged helix-turn-helix domain-containing protein [Archaeoglobus sp.]|uniref:helix-turn-helix transcriptional regulator n=1 Tax=Archaeoglobus sp. TaxID=1872626 RepID=UPI001D6E93E2|nr:winged helix-turn-helix domain-containing protein [Archaeoglobus sp.]MBO8180223.1 winged helix-turn-helix domain-containing protein [Archaeoglobus sp.]
MDTFEALACSGQRKKILNILSSSPKSTKEISDLTGISSPLISRHLKKLNELGFVEKDGTRYILTDKGYFVYLALEKFRKIVEILDKDPEFWEIHDFSGIPDEFKLRIDEIGDYEILRSGKDEVLRHFKVFSSIYTESKVVRLASAIFFPSHPKMFAEISAKADVEVIIPLKALNKLKSEYREELEHYLSNGGKIYRNDDVKLTVIVTERALCMGFFLRDGKYDTESGLLSLDSSAIRWGFELYNYFKKSAVPVEI